MSTLCVGVLQEWIENENHANLRNVLERDHFKWGERSRDMDVWHRPSPTFGFGACIMKA